MAKNDEPFYHCTPAEARERYIAELKADNERLRARVEELKRRVKGRPTPPPSSLRPDDS